MKNRKLTSRRLTLKSIGGLGALAVTAPEAFATINKAAHAQDSNDIRSTVYQKVLQTPLIDTHEHLIEEKERLAGNPHPRIKSDDWTMLLSHYLNSDMLTAGMPQDVYDRFFSRETDPADKWKLLEPIWLAVKNTGYGQAVRIAVRKLYGVEDLSAQTVKEVQKRYEKLRRPGFYKYVLHDVANIESCQVNSLTGTPFKESDMPALLMQDISIVGMFSGPNFKMYAPPSNIQVSCLSDWHSVIDWWFQTYGKYAVAVKSQNAYSRDIDYQKVPAEQVEHVFKKRLQDQSFTPAEKKALEDHLFWYAVDRATEYNLPVKLHTGYYAGPNKMPLARLLHNPGSATQLCRLSPETNFVFMHICYPYYEEMISVAKNYTNAHIDMCWAWIINPVAAKDFLKKYLVTAPANKVLTFGGDYIPVEPVAGHAAIARQGIAGAVSELVEEGWLRLDDALELIDPIMRGNARHLFHLKEKEKILATVKWKG